MALSLRARLALGVAMREQAVANELADALDATAALSATEAGYIDGVTAGTGAASKAWVNDSSAAFVHPGSLTVGANATDRVLMKGIYMTPANVAVTVPSIANDAAENGDSVAVDVSSAFSIQPAVGDAVIAIPQAALPTDCLMCGVYVTNTDEITVTFMSKEGGGGVTGAAVNFKFLVIDLT